MFEDAVEPAVAALHEAAADAARRPTAGASLALRALDGINAPLAVVDADARVLLVNRAASGVLAAGDGLGLRGERLTIAEPAAAAALRRVLRAAAAGPASEGGGQIVVPRPSGRRAYALLATPLPGTTELSAGRPAVLLHLVDPESHRRLAGVNLRRLYGLTAAEADLAAGLLHGLRLEDFAEERGVRLTTVRTQLRALFEKTDTNRQPELVRLLTRLTLLRDATEERPRHRIAARRAGTRAGHWSAGLPVAALSAGAPSGIGRLGATGAAS